MAKPTHGVHEDIRGSALPSVGVLRVAAPLRYGVPRCLRQNLFDDVSVDVGQAAVDAVLAIGESFVIDA